MFGKIKIIYKYITALFLVEVEKEKIVVNSLKLFLFMIIMYNLYESYRPCSL